MKLPARYEGPLGHSDSGVDFLELSWTIADWRDGQCPFGKLCDGKDVPAKTVAAYARKVADMIHETSRYVAEKMKIQAVAEYADRLVKYEAADKAILNAAKACVAAGIRYRDYYEDMQSAWAKVGGE